MKITLPSESEYEKSARGTDGRVYPYGNEFDATKGNTSATGTDKTSAVGIFPQGESPYGVLDASGNVWKWMRSKYQSYEYNSNDGREDEVEDSQNRRSLRGGSWGLNSVLARASCRRNLNPNGRYDGVGFFVACRPY